MSKILKYRISTFIFYSVLSLQAVSQNLNLGLQAYYDFNGNASDKSGNGNNGTVVNATLTTDRFLNNNSAYYFNGTNSSINVAYSNSLNFDPNGQFTLSVWVYPESSGYGAVLVKSPFNSNYLLSDWDYGLYQYSSATNRYMTGYASTNFLNSSASAAPAVCWTLLTVTYNEGIWDMYINGKLDAWDSTQSFRILQSMGGLAMGKKGEANGDYFKGKIDDVRLYNRALTAAEAKQLYDIPPVINPAQEVLLNCNSTEALSVSPDNLTSFLWSTGETQNQIVVDQVGKYWVSSTKNCQTKVDTFEVKSGSSNALQLDAGKDTSLPCGSTSGIQLKATEGFLSYDWSPASSLDRSNVYNPIASPSTTTTYVLKALVEDKCHNLVKDGDFTAGGTDFYSEYSLQLPVNTVEETYYANANSKLWNIGMDACFDHTTGSGIQLNVNGGQIVGKKVWCQDISVAPNTDYAFTTHIQSLFQGSPAVLQFSINGQLLAAPFTAPFNTCIWDKFYATWNSANVSNAKICIVNQNLTKFGNDFALDDISFYSYKTLTDSVKVEVPASTDKPAVQSIVICQDSKLIATATSIYDPIQWTFGESASGAANISTAKAGEHTYQKAGSYTVQLNAALGCGGAFDTTFSVVIPEKLTDPFSALIRECDSSFVVLNAKNSPGAQYVWTNRNITSDSLFKVTSSGEYEVAIAREGCVETYIAYVFFESQLNLKNTDTTLCKGDSLEVDLSNFSTVIWSDGRTEKKRFLEAPLSNLKANVNSFSCPTSKTTSFSISELTVLPPAIAGDTFFCEGTNTLLLDVSNGVPVTWSTGAVGSSTKVVSGGTVIATRSEKGCVKKDTVLVNVLPSPTLNLPKEYRFCDMDQPEGITLSALSNATDFVWLLNGVQVGSIPSYQASMEGIYQVVAALQGCSSSVETKVISSCESKLFIPTAFTPNNDGNNDTLQFFHSNVSFFHIRIFSRWGEVVYDSKIVEKGWDGIYRNQALPSGVYNYRVLYSGEQTAQKESFGEVTIVR